MSRYVYCGDERGLSVSYMMNALNVVLKIKQSCGLNYLHNPRTLRNLEHGLTEEAEELFGLGDGEIVADDYAAFKKDNGLREVALPEPDSAYRNVIEAVREARENVVFVTPQGASDLDYGLTRRFILDKYHRARLEKPIRSYLDPGTCNICVHLRAGDIYEKSRWRNVRALPPLFYERIVEQLVACLKSRYHLLVFTQTPTGHHANQLDLSEIHDWPFDNKTIFVDNSLPEDFHNMLKADVFVGSKSFLTCLIASLREGPSIVPRTLWLEYGQTENLIQVDPRVDEAGGADPVLDERTIRCLLRSCRPTEEASQSIAGA